MGFEDFCVESRKRARVSWNFEPTKNIEEWGGGAVNMWNNGGIGWVTTGTCQNELVLR